MGETFVFETERLAVRRWVASDQPLVLELYGQPKVARWIDDGQSISAQEAERWMGVTSNNYEKRGYGMFAIEDSQSAHVIGFGGIVHPGNQSDPEIKYAFQPSVWGKGLASEFVRGLMDHGRSVHGLEHFIATVASPNLASIRVLEKCGLERTGILKEDDGSETVVLEWRAA